MRVRGARLLLAQRAVDGLLPPVALRLELALDPPLGRVRVRVRVAQLVLG